MHPAPLSHHSNHSDTINLTHSHYQPVQCHALIVIYYIAIMLIWICSVSSPLDLTVPDILPKVQVDRGVRPTADTDSTKYICSISYIYINYHIVSTRMGQLLLETLP